MSTIKLSVTKTTPVTYRHLFLNEDGYMMSPPRGKIYLEPGREYDCTVINDECINFPHSMEEAVFSTFDLRDLVRTGVLTIKEP